ncbi:BTB/POZ protein [Penicillium waksmanii]|uniref:BTB/POZ protein n=1 Tax=Penicillium waksmanii TaxID=69791 RepID=UPI0025486FEA|nr:BTB/POZ protein [Penicillium waksmanii]KAJ5966162.1 BTB/POZ protein [Penicillium waksmanii]
MNMILIPSLQGRGSKNTLRGDVSLADATIKLADDSTIPIHKTILVSQCPFFRGLWLGGSWKESGDKIIYLKEDDPNAMMAMIKFLYRREYFPAKDARDSPLEFLACVYEVADKYLVHQLKKDCLTHIKSILKETRNWNADEFLRVIPFVYQSTPQTDRGLRDLMVHAASDHIEDLTKNEAYHKLDTFEFTKDVILKIGGYHHAKVCVDCGLFLRKDIQVNTCHQCGGELYLIEVHKA